ncbi:peptidylprolyl isomerase PrsA [Lactobacillus kefiranofaciens]|uniref:Foldase protein PrsA n=1 Tax=Lactobacillus kefiranofaciens TaxID=267818 RepID=A0AAX3UGF9_9LACO|nr:peptidylprolyl isomerase PrsA [Lactobacillus kefiranofaciens]AEG39921.1 Foldase protein prsA [Lactobacillus kefiranofaciens subsp. kefiranofaciens]MCP9331342.1 peptidylprolyl isomerase [Lactobacillus kefiranofaciens]MDF4141639.1 peptidylprolyl isomerase [Lactobacillus kefiranofaciens]PAK98068.1 peptidylprolyl isomerase [Lactobacillus kefiranofaciens]QFQ67522.1 peptidylprolyl isomerase [Lactobacillus kefiranofaciens subsp. kefiranofaciens]
MKSYMKKIAAVVAVAGVALSTAACSNSGSNATVASYKGGKITQQQYYDEMKKSQAGKSALANMIINRALEQQYGKYVSSKKVDKQYNNYKKQYGSQFSAVLQQNGMTASAFKQNLKTNLLSEQALKHIKKVSKKQEQQAWKNYQPKVTVQHILVAKKSTAESIIKQLKDGKSFKSLAKKYSLDTATKNKAGKLPAFDSTDNTLDSSFKSAAFKLKNGEVTSTPVKSQSGYHVIKMINRPAKGKFADHKKAIDDQIYASMAQDQATMKDVIATVLKRADVSIKDNDLKDVLSAYVSTGTTK